MNKENRAKKLANKLTAAQDTAFNLWVLLILEGLILLILYPDFIPLDWLSRVLAAVQAFFRRLLWPVGETDFLNKTYRYYIYVLVTPVKSWKYYPVLAKCAPWVIPGGLLLNMVYRAALRMCLAIAKRPVKQKNAPKAAKQPKAPKLPRQNLVSGMFSTEAVNANSYLEKKRREQPALPQTDMGLWLGNLPRTDDTVQMKDKILPWVDGRIVWEDGPCGKVTFELIDGRAYIETHGGKVPMVVGEPVVLAAGNRAGETPAACTVTWLGGFDHD